MENKELDCLLVEGRDSDGLLLKFTLRGKDPKELMDKLTEVKTLTFPDFVPLKGTTEVKKSAVSAENCPKCSSSLVEGMTKNNKKYIKCSTNKWDRIAKKVVGCDYIKWL